MGKEINRVVFDTNIIISALVFRSNSLNFLHDYWLQKRIIPLVSKATAEELIRVLSYPKFKLNQTEQNELLSDYLPSTEIITITPEQIKNLPQCRDIHDQKFIELAVVGKASYLVTGDSDLLDMKNEISVPVVTIKQWIGCFDT